MITQRVDVEPRYDNWVQWPVYWSPVWVGVLTALAVGLLIGLIGSAVGAHFLGPEHREILSWKEFKILALIFAVCGSFFAFVAGGRHLGIAGDPDRAVVEHPSAALPQPGSRPALLAVAVGVDQRDQDRHVGRVRGPRAPARRHPGSRAETA